MKSNVEEYLKQQNDAGFRLSVLSRAHELCPRGYMLQDYCKILGRELIHRPEELQRGKGDFNLYHCTINHPWIYVVAPENSDVEENHQRIVAVISRDGRNSFAVSGLDAKIETKPWDLNSEPEAESWISIPDYTVLVKTGKETQITKREFCGMAIPEGIKFAHAIGSYARPSTNEDQLDFVNRVLPALARGDFQFVTTFGVYNLEEKQ